MTSAAATHSPYDRQFGTSVQITNPTVSTLTTPSLETFSDGNVRLFNKQPSILNYSSIVYSQTDDIENEYWGDDIHQAPHHEHHRLYFQNLDGMRNDEEEIDLFISSMSQLHVDTICWADPGLDFSQLYIRKKVQNIFNNHFQRAKVNYSSSNLPSNSSCRSNGYQPGGTLSATTGSWASRTTGNSLEDPSGMGRWSGFSFLGTDNRTLSIITAYRSPRQAMCNGYGFYDQQYALLLSTGVKQPNVRKQLIQDLTKFIQGLQNQHHEIILALDANEIMEQDKHFGISSLILECNLQDLHTTQHLYPPATYKYGKDRRIDFVFGSTKVVGALEKSGYNSYDNGIQSKHRGIFIDFHFKKLLGKSPSILPASARRLSSENPTHVDEYLHHLRKYIADHNIRARVTHLHNEVELMTRDQIQKEYESIDRDITRGMLHAERKTKKPKGKYQWSPKLRAQGLVTRYWRLRLRLLHKPRSATLLMQFHCLTRRLVQLAIPCVDDLTQEFHIVKARWKASVRELKKIRVLAYEYRQNHLQATLQLYEDMVMKPPPYDFLVEDIRQRISRIKQLMGVENLRRPFRRIRSAISDASVGSISKLLIPCGSRDRRTHSLFCNPDETLTKEQLLRMAQYDKNAVMYETIIDPLAIERELLFYNWNWFRQAAETPFGHGALYDLMGFDGLTEGGEAVTNGAHPAYSGIKYSEEIETLLEELKKPTYVPLLNAHISCDEFAKAIRAWKETTSTSPSGRHLGHYKSSLQDEEITRLHAEMLNFPIAHGFAPLRWCKSVSPMIEKEPGKPYLQRLRIIHLFEADYNLFLKIIFGKRMVAQAEKLQLLNDQQYGSRPRRMTTDNLFLSRLGKDILRQTKTNSVHMDNDATGCYDRILISIAMIACRRLGVPKSALNCQAKTLKNMQYSVKHAYGISKEHYSGTELEPLFGTGQGSGASPAIWLAVVVTLLNAFDRLEKKEITSGIVTQDPWQEVSESWSISAFVDDTNQVIADHTHSLTPMQLVNRMQQSSQVWEKLLSASGGALNLSKCSWTLQIWDWKNGRPYLRPKQCNDPLLNLTNGESHEQHIITQVSNEIATKTLGVHMNSHGTFDTQAEAMMKKFEKMAARFQATNITPVLARIYYHSYFLPAAKYPLPVTSLTPKQLHRIQSKFVSVTLSKTGFNRHYPRAVAFASTWRMGVGLHDLYIEQGLSHVQSILDYIGTSHKVGKVMVVSLRTLQVESGVTFDILKKPRMDMSYLTPCWLMTLRTFCAKFDISIQVQNNRYPKLARVHDQSLMEQAITLKFGRQELIDINLVRMYLKVTVLSDITSACGTKLHPHIWRGYSIPDRASTFAFPRQESISAKQKGLWRKLLRTFLTPTATAQALVLRQPLGIWSGPSNMRWGAMVWKDTLYRCNPFVTNTTARNVSVHFKKRISKNSRTTYFDATPDWFSATIPRLASPTDLSGSLVFTASYSETEFPLSKAPARTFKKWCKQLDPRESRILSNIYYRTSKAESELIGYLQECVTIFIGTDGGKKANRGSFSWIICGPERNTLITNFGPVDGWSPCLSSFRSEATAISSVTIYLSELASYHNFAIRSCCQFYVDSKSAISNVEQLRDCIPSRRYHGNCDILSTLKSEIMILKHYKLSHVHSHQTLPFEQLAFEAQLNTLCDNMATHQMQMQEKGMTSEVSSEMFPVNQRTPIQISYCGHPITTKYVATLRKSIADKLHLEYLQRKFKWSQATIQLIAWEGIEQCMKAASKVDGATRSKIAHDWLHLGDQRSRLTKQASHSEKCPMCLAVEDFLHMLTCPSPRAQQQRYKSLQILRTSTRKIPNSAAFIDLIQQWTADHFAVTTQTADQLFQSLAKGRSDRTQLHTIICCQSQIGWLHLFRGFICSEWGSVTSDIGRNDGIAISNSNNAKFVRSIQDYSISIWKFRSTVLHEFELSTNNITQAKINHDIESLYSARDRFSDSSQGFFSRPLTIRLKDSLRIKQRWLCLTKLATSHATATGTRQQVMTTYFSNADKSERSPDSPFPALSPHDGGISGILDLPTVRYTKQPSKSLTQTTIRDFAQPTQKLI